MSCGDGTLAGYLLSPECDILGIDPFEKCITSAKENHAKDGVKFSCISFEDFSASTESFDAVIFVASLHHTDMADSVRKAKSLLRSGGILLVVGLASPSSLAEGLRVIPSAVISKLKQIRYTEDPGIPVAYTVPTMGEVRKVVKSELPSASLRYGLYYRYLLKWVKPSL